MTSILISIAPSESNYIDHNNSHINIVSQPLSHDPFWGESNEPFTGVIKDHQKTETFTLCSITVAKLWLLSINEIILWLGTLHYEELYSGQH